MNEAFPEELLKLLEFARITGETNEALCKGIILCLKLLCSNLDLLEVKHNFLICVISSFSNCFDFVCSFATHFRHLDDYKCNCVL